MNSKTYNIIIILILCYGTMFLGLLFIQFSIADWYPSLNRPTWGPPDWAFRILWPIFFTLMVIAVWLVQRKQFYNMHNSSFYWFVIQLVFNAAWPFFFFVVKSPGLAFIDGMLLFFSVIFTILSFGRISALAGWLLFPYLLWVLYAISINLMIWKTNA